MTSSHKFQLSYPLLTRFPFPSGCGLFQHKLDISDVRQALSLHLAFYLLRISLH